jgi:hypothetical protein
MNLRIADSAELVAYLHEVISLSGVEVLSADGYQVVDVRGRLFYHRPDPITVGGPFPSLGTLGRSEGVRRHHVAGDRPDAPPRVEVFEWAGRYFRIEDGRDRDAGVHASLPEATDGAAVDAADGSEPRAGGPSNGGGDRGAAGP